MDPDGLLQEADRLEEEAERLTERYSFVEAVPAAYEQVERLLRTALDLRVQAVGPHHPLVLSTWVSLADHFWNADFFNAPSRLPEAVTLYRGMISEQEQHLGPDHPDLAYTLQGLARAVDFDEAEALYLRALSIMESDPSCEPLDTIHTRAQLADVYIHLGRDEEARTTLAQAFAIAEDAIGLTKLLDTRAQLHWHRGEHQQGDALLALADSIRETKRREIYCSHGYPRDR